MWLIICCCLCVFKTKNSVFPEFGNSTEVSKRHLYQPASASKCLSSQVPIVVTCELRHSEVEAG